MTLATVTTSVSKSAVTQASLKIVELLGAQWPDLELIIWARSTQRHALADTPGMSRPTEPRTYEKVRIIMNVVLTRK